jgi:hypothetical protein
MNWGWRVEGVGEGERHGEGRISPNVGALFANISNTVGMEWRNTAVNINGVASWVNRVRGDVITGETKPIWPQLIEREFGPRFANKPTKEENFKRVHINKGINGERVEFGPTWAKF